MAEHELSHQGQGGTGSRNGELVRTYMTGVVHPVGGGWYFDEPIELTFADGRWQISLWASQFHVLLDSPPIQDFATFSNEVVSVVQGVLDAFGFSLAASLKAELSAMVTNGNTLVIRQVGWQELRANPGGPLHVSESELTPFVRAAASNLHARHALADLRAALDYPDDTAFYSYRAVETLRQAFIVGEVDSDAARKESWIALRNALGVERESIDRLRLLARTRRHGEASGLTEEERFEALTLARGMVQRFVGSL